MPVRSVVSVAVSENAEWMKTHNKCLGQQKPVRAGLGTPQLTLSLPCLPRHHSENDEKKCQIWNHYVFLSLCTSTWEDFYQNAQYWKLICSRTIKVCYLQACTCALSAWKFYCYCSLLYSAILRSRADSLRSHVILHEWVAFDSAFLNIHRSGVLTALAWLVPHEIAAISARSVYTIQPCTMSLHAKPHT